MYTNEAIAAFVPKIQKLSNYILSWFLQFQNIKNKKVKLGVWLN